MEISVSPPGWEKVELLEDVTCEVKRLSLVESMAVDKVVQQPYLKAATRKDVTREEAFEDALVDDTVFDDRYFELFRTYTRNFENLVINDTPVKTPAEILDYGLGSSPELKALYVEAIRRFIEMNRIGEVQVKNSDRPPASDLTGGQDNQTAG